MPTWDAAIWIAAGALSVSGLSFLAALWATWVSHRAYKHSRATDERDQGLAFQRERAQLLDILNVSRGMLDTTRIEIGALKATFDAEPEPVKAMLVNYTTLFTEYLPTIEGALHRTNELWADIAKRDPNKDIDMLIQQQAILRSALHGDKVAHDQGLQMVATFREKLVSARQRATART